MYACSQQMFMFDYAFIGWYLCACGLSVHIYYLVGFYETARYGRRWMSYVGGWWLVVGWQRVARTSQTVLSHASQVDVDMLLYLALSLR